MTERRPTGPLNDRPLSVLAMTILLNVSRFEAGLRVRDLVAALVRQEGRNVNAVRTAVSRASRDLERRGFVDLHPAVFGLAKAGGSMKTRRVAALAVAERAAANPLEFYRMAAAIRGDDPFGSAEKCVAAKQQQAAKPPRMYTDNITITELGRMRLELAIGGTCNFAAGGR